MNRAIFTLVIIVFSIMCTIIAPTCASAVPIDLNDFYLEGDGYISADGSLARLEVQDPNYGYTLLQNDPYSTFGADPGISVGIDALSLSFDFDFMEDAGNDTEFYFRMLDGHTGDLIDDYFVTDTSTDTVTFDLTTLLLGQDLLGLDFAITEYGGLGDTYNVGSWVTISNLDLTTQADVPAPIPEPATIILMSAGLLTLGYKTRKRRRQ